MSKYSSLPDIDSSSTDVYETPDIAQPVIPIDTTTTIPSNENISQDNLSISKAKDEFSTKEVYISEDTDFSAKIGSIKSAYKTRSVDETLEMRIDRLKREVAQVQLELESESASSNVKQDLVGLEDILNALSIKKRDNQLKLASIDTDISIESPTDTPDSVISKYIERIATLEARLSSLENRIGTATSTKPILITVDDIRRKISLFTNDPNSIQKATTNLKEIINLVDTYKTQSATAPSIDPPASSTPPPSTNESKINTLYSQLAIIDTYTPIIPKLLSRLQSLQGLHTDASSSISRLKDIDNTITLMHTEINQWRESISSLQTKLIDYDAKSAQNRAELQQWISTLES